MVAVALKMLKMKPVDDQGKDIQVALDHGGVLYQVPYIFLNLFAIFTGLYAPDIPRSSCLSSEKMSSPGAVAQQL